MSAEKLNPVPVDNATTTNSGSTSVGSGGSGPDVLGLRIGMTLAEARAIVKSRFPLTQAYFKETYQEESQTLGFSVTAQQVTGSVPNGTYVNSLRVGNRPGGWVSAPCDFRRLLADSGA